MLHERRDESFHWKNKLEELDHLPTEPAADKGELWKRLHARLNKRNNKTKPGWYWTAAACLVLAIGISWLFVEEKTGKPVTEKPLAPPQQSSNKDIAVRNELPKVDSQHVRVVVRESKKVAVIVNNKKPNIPKVSVVAEQNDLLNVPDLTDSSKLSDRSTFRPSDTVSSNSIAATNRRRLRVIHINDLEKQSEIKYTGTAFPSAQRKKSTYEGISAFSLSKNTSDDIVKIKLSPSN